ncbi:hypothetical protein ACQVP2_18885 [Methylobacterium aquaticum]|jgi:hypothetical protein|uniref:Uncharacterized protein n=1 Tax=Methylobacterium aquaticum TaxID=270351 RepID=A0A0J6T616_9HYPH|nr:hypothetical protein [Methylobacterium aquaticum]KMO41404.1 hypothetical protein VP06_01010 [Methylobacterium aquaticum]
MSQPDTPVPDPASPGRALVPIEVSAPARAVPARPLAPFLVQLIDGPDGDLRPSRRHRSQMASARYAAGETMVVRR